MKYNFAFFQNESTPLYEIAQEYIFMQEEKPRILNEYNKAFDTDRLPEFYQKYSDPKYIFPIFRMYHSSCGKIIAI